MEFQRRTHEVIDHLELAIVEASIAQPKTHKGRLEQEHYINNLLDRIAECSQRLELMLQDTTGVREKEIERITAPEGTTGDFYDQLKIVKDRHRRLESTIEDVVETEAIKASARLSDEALDGMFSGEESFGRYLDLHQQYDMYVNLKDVKKVDYFKYLAEVDNFAIIPLSTKQTATYETYVSNLLDYLKGFFSRSKPLFDIESVNACTATEFEKSWQSASCIGWEDIAKNERDDLFCKPCAKQFFNESVFKAHFTGKKHVKAAAEFKSDSNSVAHNWAREIASKEALIVSYLGLLGKIREDTKVNVECKQSRSSVEREEDIELEEAARLDDQTLNEDDKEEDGAKIYNPLNLPLDWDGKPIPYWLWKLHGLGTRYPCEICGNHVYMGRKAFDQHFFEWRHSHGLKCLGIPNTRHFFQVTTIADATSLWEKLKTEARSSSFRPDTMEEFEDQHGNVYNKKTYEDLKRQGLI